MSSCLLPAGPVGDHGDNESFLFSSLCSTVGFCNLASPPFRDQSESSSRKSTVLLNMKPESFVSSDLWFTESFHAASDCEC